MLLGHIITLMDHFDFHVFIQRDDGGVKVETDAGCLFFGLDFQHFYMTKSEAFASDFVDSLA